MRTTRLNTPLAAAAGAVMFALVAAVPASGAGAVQWNPQNKVEPVSMASGSKLVITGNTGATVTCNTVTTNLKAPINGDAAVAGTVNTSGSAASPSITNCTNSLFPLAKTTVTTSGQWLARATSTTSVDLSNVSAKVQIGTICSVTISQVSVNGNAWSNSSHQVNGNGNHSFAISQNSCDTATTATLDGTLQLPNEVTIS